MRHIIYINVPTTSIDQYENNIKCRTYVGACVCVYAFGKVEHVLNVRRVESVVRKLQQGCFVTLLTNPSTYHAIISL